MWHQFADTGNFKEEGSPLFFASFDGQGGKLLYLSFRSFQWHNRKNFAGQRSLSMTVHAFTTVIPTVRCNVACRPT